MPIHQHLLVSHSFYCAILLLSRTFVGDNMCEIVAKRLRECRIEAKLTQLQVSIYCDITEKAYQNYELMTREPRLDILIRLADLFDVSLDYLAGRTDQRAVNK